MKNRLLNSAGDLQRRGKASPFRATLFACCARCRIAARFSLKCTLEKLRRPKARFNWSALIPSDARSRRHATGPSPDRRAYSRAHSWHSKKLNPGYLSGRLPAWFRPVWTAYLAASTGLGERPKARREDAGSYGSNGEQHGRFGFKRAMEFSAPRIERPGNFVCLEPQR
jgi:hypothetical protein